MTAPDAPSTALAGRGSAAVAVALALAVLGAIRAVSGDTTAPAPWALSTVAVGFAGVGTWLSWTDLRTHRLPNRVVLTAAAGFFTVAATEAAVSRDGTPLARALLGGVGLCLVFAVAALALPGSLGGGDVKLALLTGGLSAWIGWPPFAIAVGSAFLTAGAVSVVLVGLRRARAATRIAFGPFLCAGVWAGFFAG